MTPFQRRALEALEQGRAPAAELVLRMGYQGKTSSPYGGAGRAPMYWGRATSALRDLQDGPHYQRSYIGNSSHYELTENGRRALRIIRQAEELLK